MSLTTKFQNYFMQYQKQWISDPADIKFYEKSRRIGITYATSFEVVLKCLERPGHLQWVTSRDELTAGEFVRDYVRKWSKLANATCHGLAGDRYDVIDEAKGIKAFVVEYSNGSRIISLSSTPEAFAGKGGDILIDEMDLHKNQGKLYDMAIPCTTWGGKLAAVSALSVDGGPTTVFCKTCTDARADNPMHISLHRTNIEDAVAQGFVEKLNETLGKHYTRKEWLTMMRSKCRTQEAWNTQYMLIPSTDSGAMLHYDLIRSCELLRSEIAQKTTAAINAPRFAGYDVARIHDLAVYSEFALIGDVLLQTDLTCLKNTSFPAQEDFLKSKLNNRNLRRLCIDYTGMGGPVTEHLQKVYGKYRVEGVNFSTVTKEVMATELRACFEDRRIRIFSDDKLREGLHKVEKIVTASGAIRYNAERDSEGHGDEFWSVALAKFASGNMNNGPVIVVPAALQKANLVTQNYADDYPAAAWAY